MFWPFIDIDKCYVNILVLAFILTEYGVSIVYGGIYIVGDF